MDSLLRSLYYCFSDSPARREDFSSATGGKTNFPLKFCATRWIEDVQVAERALKVWPDVKTYVKETQKLSKSKQPSCQSFLNLVEYSQDVLVPAKLHFFISVAKLLKPFLERYQTEKPMMPFIAADLQGVLVSVLCRFIKQSVLNDITTQQGLAKLDVKKKDNIISPPEKVEIGFASKQAVESAKKEKSCQVSQRQLYEFYQECIAFLRGVAEKIQERSPLKYSVVRALQALDPTFLIANHDKAIQKFEILLQKLLEAKWLTAERCDTAAQQFKAWIAEVQKSSVKKAFEEFDRTEDRLDSFFSDLLAKKQNYKDLWHILKILLVLSHGQSAVERGFSTNKDMLAANLGKEGLVALRTVYDGVQYVLEIKNEENSKLGKDTVSKDDVAAVPITKKMIESCKGSRTRYQNYMDDLAKQKKVAEKDAKKSGLKTELASLRTRKRKLESSVEDLEKEANELAVQAEKKMKFDILAKSNAFRSKATEQRKELLELNKKIESVSKNIEAV